MICFVISKNQALMASITTWPYKDLSSKPPRSTLISTLLSTCVRSLIHSHWKICLLEFYVQRFSRPALSNRNKMWAMNLILNFLLATLKRGEKNDKINFNSIFYLTQLYWNIILTHSQHKTLLMRFKNYYYYYF